MRTRMMMTALKVSNEKKNGNNSHELAKKWVRDNNQPKPESIYDSNETTHGFSLDKIENMILSNRKKVNGTCEDGMKTVVIVKRAKKVSFMK